MEQLYGAKRPFAFVGSYNAPGKKIMIEMLNSKDYGIRDGVIFDFATTFKPVPRQPGIVRGRAFSVITGTGPGGRYATRFDPVTHLPLDLKIPADSFSILNMEVQPHEKIPYGSYLIRNTTTPAYDDTLSLESGNVGPNISLSSPYYNLPGKYIWVIQRSDAYGFNHWKKDQSLRLPFELLAPAVIDKKVSLKQVVSWSIVTLLCFAILFFLFRRLYKRRLETATQARQTAYRQLRAVRAQLNPHFIFNAPSSIQNLMNKQDVDGANHYLVKFASLTHKVLDSAEQELISAEEEIQSLDDYLQMEQLRFRFQYSIKVDAAINQANTEIPAMLLQPFVENAVKHAVSGLHEQGMITVGVRRNGKDLILTVKDNGPGFDGLAGNPGKNSLGIRLSRERIALLNELYKGKTATLTIHFEVIFITAYDQYGIQAIKFSALDYLLKPIGIEEFKSAIQKAKDKIKSRQTNHNIENLLEYIKRGQNETPKMALPTLEEIRYVPVTGIIRCQASDNYTLFHLDSGEQVLVCRTLKEDGGSLLLKDQTKIPISRQNRDLVKEALNKGL